MTPVVRVGDTVRRQAGPWTPTIHALLTHVRRQGFCHGPEPLGFDNEGREILTYIQGEAGRYPLPDWMWADEILLAAAKLLARVQVRHQDDVPPLHRGAHEDGKADALGACVSHPTSKPVRR